MNDDKDKRYMMGDDERATIGQRERSKRDSDSPAKRRARFDAFLASIPTTWKAITLIGTIFLAGVVGHAYLIEYTKKYATKDDLAGHTLRETDLREQVRALRESDAARAADISAIKSDTAAVREDIRTLLQFMLSNPPVRNAPANTRKP